MKIGIITLIGNYNYGNRLQNYALQMLLESKFSAEVDTLTFSTNDFKDSPFAQKKSVLNKVSSLKDGFGEKIRRRIFKIDDFKKQTKLKTPVFRPFSDAVFSFVEVTKQNVDEIISQYDYFVIGSDQVWNPSFEGNNYAMYAEFAPKEKVVSYAASFGVSDIPSEYNQFVKEGLTNVSRISVREADGADIVNRMIGSKAQVVLDPTMMISSDIWKQAISSVKSDKLPRGKYIFVYFLGKLSKMKQNTINEFARKNDYEILTVMGNEAKAGTVALSPLEFVKGIKNAEMVFTDSFHGNVFSILMHTPFKIFEREDGGMQSRIVTLLETVGLPLSLISDNDIEHVRQTIDYSNIDNLLDEKRQESMNFLTTALCTENSI